jgi:trimethylamine:corrinoid methyltransferase-like protein
LLVRNQRARQIFKEHGAQVDEASEIVRIPGKSSSATG